MHAGLIRDIQAETGFDVHSRKIHSVWVALEEAEYPALRELSESDQQNVGFAARSLSGSEIRPLEPRVSARAIKAVYAESIMQMDNYNYTVSLALAADRYEVSVKHGTVEGLTSIHGG